MAERREHFVTTKQFLDSARSLDITQSKASTNYSTIPLMQMLSALEAH